MRTKISRLHRFLPISIIKAYTMNFTAIAVAKMQSSYKNWKYFCNFLGFCSNGACQSRLVRSFRPMTFGKSFGVRSKETFSQLIIRWRQLAYQYILHFILPLKYCPVPTELPREECLNGHSSVCIQSKEHWVCSHCMRFATCSRAFLMNNHRFTNCPYSPIVGHSWIW